MYDSNPCLMTDSYKPSQWKGYPPGTSNVYSYFESRGGKFDETVFFGLQYIIDEVIGHPVNMGDVVEAEAFFAQHYGRNDVFNRKGWLRIIEKFNGFFPVNIKAVPEGTVVPTRNVLFTIENEDPESAWVTNYLETVLVQAWYPCTVATLSREIRKVILKALHETGDPSLIDYKLHDFGFRGCSSVQSAALGGAAHLLSFNGSDTLVAMKLAQDYYGYTGMAGHSIPATEHSNMTSWGGVQGELDSMRNWLEQYPTGLIACVSDSYDIMRACKDYWGGELKSKVLGRDGTVVVRPDSGDPPSMVVKVLEALGDSFGYEKNRKGYKILPPQVRVLQGDGINYESIKQILYMMDMNGWSADNVAFGMGGALLQKVDRDTQKHALKCSSITVDGRERDVFKDPVTDPGKASKRGRFMLQYSPSTGLLETIQADPAREDYNLLQDVYHGESPVYNPWDDVVRRARSGLEG